VCVCISIIIFGSTRNQTHASSRLGKHFTTDLHSQPLNTAFKTKKKKKSAYLFYLTIYQLHAGQAQTNIHEVLLPDN
jgi:hypothetical protein